MQLNGRHLLFYIENYFLYFSKFSKYFFTFLFPVFVSDCFEGNDKEDEKEDEEEGNPNAIEPSRSFQVEPAWS